MSERIIKAKKILSGDNSGVVFSGQEKASYATDYDSDDFLDSDLITKKATLQLVEENAVPSDTVIESWSALKSTDTDVARKHEIDGVTYLFTSKVDDNISEPVLSSGGSWIKSGDTPDLLPLWSSLTTYSTGEFVRRSQTVDGVLHNYAFKSKENGNNDHNPLDFDGVYWEFLGENRGRYVPGTLYNNGDVVVDDTSGTNSVFISQSDNNDSPTSSTGSTWQVIGGSSGSSGKKGLFSVADTGQSEILIPHGLDDTPVWYNIFAPDLNTRNLMNSTSWTADGTNLIGTPDFLNNDGQILNILWKAEL